ncbi:hypothetical protein ACKKBG_A27300 [Auxenochlorella protothecoides x Auxenochlorella symbiontica]|uniref:CBM20 domain-containing protein n=1 Tax=Auxenochlorella protothecoides TaxID=3075 RepID=A0A1D2ACW8_AUXPR
MLGVSSTAFRGLCLSPAAGKHHVKTAHAHCNRRKAPGRLTATIAHQPAAGRSVKVVTPSCPLAFGDELVVVGSHQGWKPEAGTVLTWTEGDTWVGELSKQLTDPALEFKLVVRHGDGSTDWESGDNRSVQLPPGPAVVTCTWGDASRTLVDQESPAPEVEEQERPGAEVEGEDGAGKAESDVAVEPSPGTIVAEQASGPTETTAPATAAQAEAPNGADGASQKQAQEQQPGEDTGSTPAAPSARQEGTQAHQAATRGNISAPKPVAEPDSVGDKDPTPAPAAAVSSEPPAPTQASPPAAAPAPAKGEGSGAEEPVPEKHHPTEAWESRPDGEATLYTFKDAGVEESAATLAARQLLSDLPKEAVADLKSGRQIDTGGVE